MKQLQPLFAVACLLMLSGCGSKSELDLVPLRGEVTYNGQPLVDATVVYLPAASAEGRQASGTTQSDGSFTLTTLKRDDGVMRGDYQVAVFAYAPKAAEPTTRGEIDALAAAGKLDRGYVIPKKYADPGTSGLSDTVNDDHSGFKKFELTD